MEAVGGRLQGILGQEAVGTRWWSARGVEELWGGGHYLSPLDHLHYRPGKWRVKKS